MFDIQNTQQIATILDGKIVFQNDNFDFSKNDDFAVITDTRKLNDETLQHKNILFVVLKGENFDAHDFLPEIIKNQNQNQNIYAILIDNANKFNNLNLQKAENSLSVILVNDTRLALGNLAKHWRNNFDNSQLQIFGITGSNGKTTTKEMLGKILRQHFGEQNVLATVGNLNNDIGLPLTLLNLRKHHQAAVIEMGMNHPGEIEYLAEIAKPNFSAITTIQRAHLQGMQNLQIIAREKGAIYKFTQNVAVINLNFLQSSPEFVDLWENICQENPQKISVNYFDFDNKNQTNQTNQTKAKINFQNLVENNQNCLLIKNQNANQNEKIILQVLGNHNAYNAATATALALAAGIDLATIKTALQDFQAVKGRLQIKKAAYPITLWDDTYNANPDSVKAAIDVLANFDGKKILILGDMGEIGENSENLHKEVGIYARQKNIDYLLCLGESTQFTATAFDEFLPKPKNPALYFANGKINKLTDYLKMLLTMLLQAVVGDKIAVLVKGSRFMKMERIVEELVNTRK